MRPCFYPNALKEIALDFILTNLTAKEIQKGLSVSEIMLGIDMVQLGKGSGQLPQDATGKSLNFDSRATSKCF